jgi:hypothetical protein
MTKVTVGFAILRTRLKAKGQRTISRTATQLSTCNSVSSVLLTGTTAHLRRHNFSFQALNTAINCSVDYHYVKGVSMTMRHLIITARMQKSQSPWQLWKKNLLCLKLHEPHTWPPLQFCFYMHTVTSSDKSLRICFKGDLQYRKATTE